MTTNGSSKPAVLYARYSTDQQNDASIEAQFQLCEKFAASKGGFKIVGRFEDRAKSSATLVDRDGLNALLAEAKPGKFRTVIVESLDRLSRDMVDLPTIFQRLKFRGVEISTVNEGVANTILVGLRALMGQITLGDVSDKTRRGADERARRGMVPGGIAYGYDRVAGKPGERAINETQAAIVRRVFTEYAGGKSVRDIAGGLNRDGVPPPRGAKAWSHQTFIGGKVSLGIKRGMISNPIYIGKLTWNMTRQVMDPERKIKVKRAAPVEDRIDINLPHLRIVDQDLWDRASAVRAARSVIRDRSGKTIRTPMMPRGDYLLAGQIVCGKCNGFMRVSGGEREKGRVWISCADAFRFGTCDHRRSYQLGTIQNAMRDLCRSRLADPALIRAAAEAYAKEQADSGRSNRSQLNAARKKHADLEFKIKRLTALALTIPEGGSITHIADEIAQAERDRVGLAQTVTLLEANTKVTELHPRFMDEYQKTIEAFVGSMDADTAEARAAARQFLHSVVVHPTPVRTPAEISVYCRASALLVVDVLGAAPNFDSVKTSKGGPS